MSRRDTVIIAMLVNAGLLALLFLLAINTDDDVVMSHPAIATAIIENQEIASTLALSHNSSDSTSVNDEVDNFLKDLTDEEPSQSMVIDEEGYVVLQPEPPVIVSPPPSEPARTKPNPTRSTATTARSTEDVRYVEVTVKRGDALEKIARNNGTTVEAIKKANNLSSTKLSIGQVLRIPVSNKTVAEASPTQQVRASQPAPTTSTPAATNNFQYYTVKRGDNPWKIAKQFNVGFEELLRMNNLDEERARNMKIGDKIRVK